MHFQRKWASLLRFASTAGWHCSVCAPACLRLRLRTMMPAGGSSTGAQGHWLMWAWLAQRDAVADCQQSTGFGYCLLLQVYIVHRRNEFRASKVMQKRALEHEKIKVGLLGWG